MPILRFETNIPLALRLIRLEGRSAESRFGGLQTMFMAQEGAFYVSEKVGAILGDQFSKLGVKPGDLIEITKAEVGRGPERRTQWIVSTSVPAQDATLAVPKLPEPPAAPEPEPVTDLEKTLAASIQMVEQRKQAASATSAAPAWANYLVQQTNALVDSYAAVLEMANKKHGTLVKAEDVRSLLLSCFINATKSGGRNAA